MSKIFTFLYTVSGVIGPCNSFFGENDFSYKLVARKLHFVLSKLQILI